MAVIHRDTLNAVLPATTSDDTRFSLSGIEVRPDGRVAATDGHIAITARNRHPMPDEDFPQVPGAPFKGDVPAPIVIDRDTVKSLVAGTPKAKRNRANFPILQGVQIGQNDTGALAVSTDLTVPRVAHILPREGERFPDLSRVMPKADRCDVVKVCLASDVLKAVLDAAKAIQNDHARMQTITFDVPIGRRDMISKDRREVAGAIRFTMVSDTVEIEGVLMPCRV